MTPVHRVLHALRECGPVLGKAAAGGNLRVVRSMLGPAWRGLVLKRGRDEPNTRMSVRHEADFNWSYSHDHPEMKRLFGHAKRGQWDADERLDWTINVDPDDPERPLLPDDYLPMSTLPSWRKLDRARQSEIRRSVLSWLLSQFLHGEQGALYAAAQVTQAVPWHDGKLFGSTQVVDEGRHVEVFHRYLAEKLGKVYEINDNLYVIIDSLMGDSRWDVKFLGMQIMIEGLALGAFGSLRQVSAEPLVRDLLGAVITDEARHVHYGVLALQEVYSGGLSERERREREDWAFELSMLLRDRFLMHEIYDEYYGHEMSRAAWDRLIMESRFMDLFRKTMFKRVIPNLRRIHLLSDRIRPRYGELGLLEFAEGRAAPDLSAEDLLADAA